MSARRWLGLVFASTWIFAAGGAQARPHPEARPRGLLAVVEELPPVTWGAAGGRGEVSSAGRTGQGELSFVVPRGELRARATWDDGSGVALVGFRLLSVAQDEGITARGLADL